MRTRRRSVEKMRSVDFVLRWGWWIISSRETSCWTILGDSRRDCDSFIVWLWSSKRPLSCLPSLDVMMMKKIPSSFNCVWGGDAMGGVDEMFITKISRRSRHQPSGWGWRCCCSTGMMARAGPAAHHGMKQFHKSHASFCRSLISTLLSFLTIFRSRNFFEFSPMSRAGEKMLLFRYTPCVLCVCVCTQDTGYPVRQTTSHRILYRGDGKTNWTDCIKAAKKTSKNFFNYGLLGWGGGVGHWRPSGGDNSSVFFFFPASFSPQKVNQWQVPSQSAPKIQFGTSVGKEKEEKRNPFSFPSTASRRPDYVPHHTRDLFLV